ncbi:MAG: hypothetical protein QF464_12320, partial [Myxococcota bacterium]|nr:hypothetical protein [Myxococcota bacterium]
MRTLLVVIISSFTVLAAGCYGEPGAGTSIPTGACCQPNIDGVSECLDDVEEEYCDASEGVFTLGGACGEGCACLANCAGKACGDDGCGGTCGTCGDEKYCTTGACVPIGACTNDADMAIINDESVDVPAITQESAFACLTAEDIGTCTAYDVSGQTGLSI